MSCTIYGNVTENNISIDDMVDDSRDIIYTVDDTFFARLVCAREDINDDPDPAIAIFHKDEPFTAIFATVLPGQYNEYFDGWSETDLFREKLKDCIKEFNVFMEGRV